MAKSSNRSPKKTPKLPKALRQGDLPRSLDEVWAAGMGALHQAQKTGADSFDALVALGSRVLETGSKAARSAAGHVESAADSLTSTARGLAGGTVDGVQERIEDVVEAVLGRIGVPGREEVMALRGQVEALEARLLALTGDAAEGTSEGASVVAYEVRPHERGWAVQKAGAERATAVHATKKEALRDARQTARAHAPSRLTVFKTDGSVGEETGYEA